MENDKTLTMTDPIPATAATAAAQPAAEPKDKILTITGENFATEVLGSKIPVLVDFWAPWCGPCRMVAPVLEELADEMDGKVRIAKLNVDEQQQIAMQFSVRSIPMFLLFKEGKVADQAVGVMPKSNFERFLQRNL